MIGFEIEEEWAVRSPVNAALGITATISPIVAQTLNTEIFVLDVWFETEDLEELMWRRVLICDVKQVLEIIKNPVLKKHAISMLINENFELSKFSVCEVARIVQVRTKCGRVCYGVENSDADLHLVNNPLNKSADVDAICAEVYNRSTLTPF